MKGFEENIKNIEQKIQEGLPGMHSQIKMVSDTFKNRYFDMQPNEQTREGGVLILLYPEENQLHIPFILRPATEKGVHSGQVAFPGGKKEETDKDLINTALREAEEEVHLDTSQITVIGQLSPLFVFASNFMVYPTLAYTEKPPILKPNPEEVAEIFSANVEHLKHPQTIKKTTIKTPQYTFETPYYDVNGKIIWGATAMMLSELLEII
jgi:8-oxo-dGTP pyrophosphatase MutT (NUDIX family)